MYLALTDTAWLAIHPCIYICSVHIEASSSTRNDRTISGISIAMAGAIKRYWESTKNQLARYVDVWRVACDMEAGGCLDLGGKAMHA
jgi:hypothetical protein